MPFWRSVVRGGGIAEGRAMMSLQDLLASEQARALVMPFTVAQYHRFRDSGWLSEKTELLEGVILQKLTKSPRHSYLINVLQQCLSAQLPVGYLLRKEDPLTLADSEPEPDLSIVRGELADFRDTHPSTAELVVEVAISSLELDRAKASVYARAGIPEYWIVQPGARCIEVYDEPSVAGYGRCREMAVGEVYRSRWGDVDLAVLLGGDGS